MRLLIGLRTSPGLDFYRPSIVGTEKQSSRYSRPPKNWTLRRSWNAAPKGGDGVETARLLIDAGIDLSVTDERGRTAPGYSMEQDAPKLAWLLAGTADAGPSDLTTTSTSCKFSARARSRVSG
jgi:hypothetical protein